MAAGTILAVAGAKGTGCSTYVVGRTPATGSWRRPIGGTGGGGGAAAFGCIVVEELGPGPAETVAPVGGQAHGSGSAESGSGVEVRSGDGGGDRGHGGPTSGSWPRKASCPPR
eukprot:4519666-Alexandrium_andersonii.AAC.1